MSAIGPGTQSFTQKLIGNREYGNLLLRFRPHDGAHGPMHRGAWYIGRAKRSCDAQARLHQVFSHGFGQCPGFFRWSRPAQAQLR